MHQQINIFTIAVYLYLNLIIFTGGVTVHKNDGSVHTSVLKSRFNMFSVQQEGKNLLGY